MQKIVLACVDLSKRAMSSFDLTNANLTGTKPENGMPTSANLTSASWTTPRFKESA